MSYTTNYDKRYLDLNGLSYYDGKLKEWVGREISSELAALNDYYTKDAADAKFATQSSLTDYVNSVSAKIDNGDAAKKLWDSFLTGYNGTTGTAAPTLQEIKDFMNTTVPTTYASKTELSGAIEGLADIYLKRADFATEKDALTNLIANNKTSIEQLATTVEDNATAAANALNEAVNTINGTITTLEGKITNNTTNIGTLTTSFGEYKTSNDVAVAANKAAHEKNTSDIAALTATVESNATAASNALATAKSELEGSIAGVKATADKNAEDIVALKNGLSGAVHFKGVVSELPASANNGDIYIVVGEGQDSGAEYVYIADGAKWEKLGDTTSETNRISALETKVGEHTTAIAANTSDISTLTTTVADNKAAAENAIKAVDAKADKNAADIATNASDISDLSTTVANNKTAAEEAIAANGTLISNLDTKVEGYNTTLTNAVAGCVKVADFITTNDIDALFAIPA